MMFQKAGQSVERRKSSLDAHFGVFRQVIKTVLIGIFRCDLKLCTLEKEENKIRRGQEAGASKKGSKMTLKMGHWGGVRCRARVIIEMYTPHYPSVLK